MYLFLCYHRIVRIAKTSYSLSIVDGCWRHRHWAPLVRARLSFFVGSRSSACARIIVTVCHWAHSARWLMWTVNTLQYVNRYEPNVLFPMIQWLIIDNMCLIRMCAHSIRQNKDRNDRKGSDSWQTEMTLPPSYPLSSVTSATSAAPTAHSILF